MPLSRPLPSALLLRVDAYGEDIAGRAVQHAIRGRTENQGQSVASIAAHYGEIHRVFASEAMHFLGRLANQNVALCRLEAIFPGEGLQSFAGHAQRRPE